MGTLIRRHGSEWPRALRLPHGAIHAAIGGQGVILVRRILVADELEAARLIRLGDVSVQLEKALYFVCREGDQQSPPVSTLRAWLTEICKR